MKNFYKIIYSNDAIVAQRRANLALVGLVFLVSVLLIASPNLLGRLMENPSKLATAYPGIEKPLVRVLSEHDCLINQTLQCNFEDEVIFTSTPYTVVVNAKPGRSLAEFKGNYLVFSEVGVFISYHGNELKGDYSLFDQVHFSQLLNLRQTLQISDVELAGHFLQNINLAFFQSMGLVMYILIFMQYVFYVLVVAMIVRFINVKQIEVAFSFREIVTMIVLSLFTPALLMALLGLYNPFVASALLPILIMVRIMFIYYKLLKNQKNQLNRIEVTG